MSNWVKECVLVVLYEKQKYPSKGRRGVATVQEQEEGDHNPVGSELAYIEQRYEVRQNTKYVCPHVVVIQSHLRILPQTPELDGRRGQFLFQILLNTVKARRRYRYV